MRCEKKRKKEEENNVKGEFGGYGKSEGMLVQARVG